MSNFTRFSDLLNDTVTKISIPVINGHETTLEAAISYAHCGWYVLPVRLGTKNPGSIVGANWPMQSSRDEEKLNEWFRGANVGLALHAGRSGAVIFDVDKPENLPSALKKRFDSTSAPMQGTRPDNLERGHYFFAVQSGQKFANSGGRLGSTWGEVRSHNGVVMVSPSEHPDGGRYFWRRIGVLPTLPAEIAAQLNPVSMNSAIPSSTEILSAIESNDRGADTDLLQTRISRTISNSQAGTSRHDSFRDGLLQALLDARCGLYPMALAIERFSCEFDTIKPESERTPHEFRSMAEWCVSRSLELSEVEVAQRLAALSISGQVRRND